MMYLIAIGSIDTAYSPRYTFGISGFKSLLHRYTLNIITLTDRKLALRTQHYCFQKYYMKLDEARIALTPQIGVGYRDRHEGFTQTAGQHSDG